jgi:transcriptional regulator with XRE-family HTH domain
MGAHRASRSCIRCGGELSTYNPKPVCSACRHLGRMSESDADYDASEPWLERPEATLVRDDAGVRLREWRLLNGQSQAATAEAIGVTQQHLSQVENGRRTLSIEHRRRIVETLGIAPEELGLAPGMELRHGDRDEHAAGVASVARWRAERRWLNQHRSELARLAVDLYPEEHRVPSTLLVAHPRWIPGGPIELSSIRLDELDEGPQAVAVNGAEPETITVRPLRAPGLHFERYTAAVRRLDPPRLFESRPSYRLLATDLDRRRLRFGMAAYFDKLDVSEALGHEIAAVCMRLPDGLPPSVVTLRDQLPFRHLIGDPFDPQRRAIIPAVTTLTIRLRRFPAEPSFLLHWRDPAKVATAGGVYDVVPAGEFQPSSVALWDRRNDFDLWRNIVREYAEELLGEPEHDGTRTTPIDYERWRLYQDLEAARSDGRVSSFLLGLGLDALTLAATILTVVIIDDDVFGELFGGAVRYNEEGEIVAIGDGRVTEGVPFTAAAVERMLVSEPMASPGAACLALAWRHRDMLLGA